MSKCCFWNSYLLSVWVYIMMLFGVWWFVNFIHPLCIVLNPLVKNVMIMMKLFCWTFQATSSDHDNDGEDKGTCFHSATLFHFLHLSWLHCSRKGHWHRKIVNSGLIYMVKSVKNNKFQRSLTLQLLYYQYLTTTTPLLSDLPMPMEKATSCFMIFIQSKLFTKLGLNYSTSTFLTSFNIQIVFQCQLFSCFIRYSYRETTERTGWYTMQNPIVCWKWAFETKFLLQIKLEKKKLHVFAVAVFMSFYKYWLWTLSLCSSFVKSYPPNIFAVL